MKEQNRETRNTETITISRAEYDAQKAQLAELQSRNEWLMEQLRLLKKKQFGSSSEQTAEQLDGQLRAYPQIVRPPLACIFSAI